VAGDRPDVLILYNHGIIVAGETVDEVRARIDRVNTVLTMPERPAATPDPTTLSRLVEGAEFHVAEDAESHKTALNEASLAFAAGGSLYPDHVIFLGTEIGILNTGETVAYHATARKAAGKPMPRILLVPGKGVLLANELSAGGRVMARCLAEVVSRIPSGQTLVYLDGAQEYELTHWEAEQYRQALDRKASLKA
jgi:rhamnose utilization protein RhaD (predicted bifunctional aldolase and dehydrogenase)